MLLKVLILVAESQLILELNVEGENRMPKTVNVNLTYPN